MHLSQILTDLMEKQNVSAYKFSKDTGISDRLVGYWKKGDKLPSAENLIIIANYFSTSVDHLLGRDETTASEEVSSAYTPDEKKHIRKYRFLDDHGKKIIDFCLDEEYDRCIADKETAKPETIMIKFAYLPASAGTGLELPEESYRSLEVKASKLTKEADFAVRVSGNSMEPTYSDGDILLVVNMPCINVGDIGVFVLNGEGYIKEFGGDKLISHNPDYPDIKLSEHDVVMCSGKVIGILENEDFV